MSDPLQHTPRELGFTAYLRRFSRATRIIGILNIVGSLFMVAAALDMHNESDRIGFSLCSMAILLFGVLVWATGVFHGAVSSMMPVLAAIDFKLERLTRLQTMQATAKPADAALPVAQNPFLTDADEAVSERPAPPPPKPPKVEPPPPEKVPCPSCGGLIHPEASRCVHCMKRITLKQAS